ncbi:DUF6519 domain-containing protein [Sphingomonas sp.]|uniref:DUF6519 domain-containing protein n=1 Tax=Sphingomonas sp. TaxID=28214 RepID=UPI0035BBEBF3
MRGDFSRDSFDPLAGFTRVLQQQGRVRIDADGNEGEAIQLHLLRRLAADLIGPHGGTAGAFALAESEKLGFDFAIGPGRYYVDGVAVENGDPVHYRGDVADHRGQPGARAEQPKPGDFLAYLDVWERHVSALEHDGALARNDPRRLAEVALLGQDTASRAQVAWAVRLAPLEREDDGNLRETGDAGALLTAILPPARGRLTARAVDPAAAESDDPCLVSPTAAYRGIENQLYRVEIRQGGTAAERATFVWSRENGSVLFAVDAIEGKRIRLAEGWHDARFGLDAGDFVSVEGPEQRLGAPAPLVRVTRYDGEAVEIDVDTAPGLDAGAGDVVLRRWDHRQRPASAGAGHIVGGAIGIVEGEWIALEDGISIRFEAGGEAGAARYRAGDYWLIPARTEIGDVLWPSDANGPVAVEPHGIDRHLAPLGIVQFDPQGRFGLLRDLRRTITPLAQ